MSKYFEFLTQRFVWIYFAVYRCLTRLALTLLHRLASLFYMNLIHFIVAAIDGTKNLIKDSKVSDSDLTPFCQNFQNSCLQLRKGVLHPRKLRTLPLGMAQENLTFPFLSCYWDGSRLLIDWWYMWSADYDTTQAQIGRGHNMWFTSHPFAPPLYVNILENITYTPQFISPYCFCGPPFYMNFRFSLLATGSGRAPL